MLNINCKEKKTVGKANKGKKVEKYNRFKNFKRREKKKKGNSTELQKPNIEAEVYNNNKECD